MDEDPVRLEFIENADHAAQNGGGNMDQVLVVAHDIEVEFGRDGEQPQHLVQHGAMLGRDADAGLDAGGIGQGLDDRGHLDRLWPGSENTQYTHSGL